MRTPRFEVRTRLAAGLLGVVAGLAVGSATEVVFVTSPGAVAASQAVRDQAKQLGGDTAAGKAYLATHMPEAKQTDTTTKRIDTGLSIFVGGMAAGFVSYGLYRNRGHVAATEAATLNQPVSALPETEASESATPVSAEVTTVPPDTDEQIALSA